MTKTESDRVITLHWVYFVSSFNRNYLNIKVQRTIATNEMNISKADLIDQLKHTGKLWYLVNPYETIFEFPHEVPDYQQQVTIFIFYNNIKRETRLFLPLMPQNYLYN